MITFLRNIIVKKKYCQYATVIFSFKIVFLIQSSEMFGSERIIVEEARVRYLTLKKNPRTSVTWRQKK